MSYGSVVGADAPKHWWRCADPGGSLLHDIGSGPQRAMSTTGGVVQLAYSGVASEGGSVWVDSNQAAWHNSGDSVQSPASIECWVWLHTFRTTAVEPFAHYQNLQVNAAGTVTFASGGPNVTSPAAITEQAWHHLVGTYGAVGGAKLYVDGVNVVTAAFTAGFGPFVQVPAIGMSGAATLFASANIAECATYGVELSAARVAAHFAAADTIATRPVYKALGSTSVITGISDLSATDIAAILAAVRRTY